MNRLIIKLIGLSRYSHPRRGKYIYNPDYGGYIWKGRPLTLEEFNKESVHALDNFDRNNAYWPTVKAIGVEEDPQVDDAPPPDNGEEVTDAQRKEIAEQTRAENEANGVAPDEEQPPEEQESDSGDDDPGSESTAASDEDADKPVSYKHRGRGKYDVYNAAGDVVANNVTKEKAQELVPE